MNRGIKFEQQCIEKLLKLGFKNVESTPETTDFGVDIIAYHNNIKYIFQCKDWKKKPGEVAVREILAAKSLFEANRCGVISKSGFTSAAYRLAKPNFILLITWDNLIEAAKVSDLLIENLETNAFSVPINYNYDIISEFEKLKEQIGHTPTLNDLGKTLRYRIRKEYKSYSVFLKSIGERFKRSKLTDMQVKSEYLRIRNFLGKTPTAEDIKKNTAFPYNSFHVYPLSRLQKECGDIPNCDRSYTKEELVAEYIELEKKLGHKPNGSEIDKYGKHNSALYIRAFGSLTNFYKDSRINAEKLIKKSLTKTEVIIIYTLLEEIFKHINMDFPASFRKLENVQYQRKSILKSNQIEYLFKNIKNFLSVMENNGDVIKFRNAVKKLIKEFERGTNL